MWLFATVADYCQSKLIKPHPDEADFTLSCCLIIYPFFSQTGPTEIQDLIVQTVIVIIILFRTGPFKKLHTLL